MKVISTLAMIAGLCVAGTAAAQSSGQQSTTPASPSAGKTATPAQTKAERADKAGMRQEARVEGKDAGFLKQAAQNGHAEIEASKLAQTKATQSDVKTFAGKMVEDHQKASQELMQLAQSKGVKLPDDPSLMQRGRLKLLSGADGEKFDRRYAESFGVKAHEDNLKLFKEAAANAKDADVKAFAQKTLPKLEEHLTMARSMESAVAPTAAGQRPDRTGDRAGTSKSSTTTGKSQGTGG
jgi:putative membrane protein